MHEILVLNIVRNTSHISRRKEIPTYFFELCELPLSKHTQIKTISWKLLLHHLVIGKLPEYGAAKGGIRAWAFLSPCFFIQAHLYIFQLYLANLEEPRYSPRRLSKYTRGVCIRESTFVWRFDSEIPWTRMEKKESSGAPWYIDSLAWSRILLRI